ncbi:MAG: hypothetical protein MJ241_00070 [Bacilli bacterium]|nr:hypothetical protein [Bacilli bacterium]
MKIKLTADELEDFGQLLQQLDENIEAADVYNDILSNGYLVDTDSSMFPIAKLNPEPYYNDPYMKNVRPKQTKIGRWSLRTAKYVPHQGFLYDEISSKEEDGYREHTPFGYFEKPFNYLALDEGKTNWMSITPHEINTMKTAIKEAKGKVLVLGLGLGYYPYMISQKQEVKSIDIVEIAREPIEIFKQAIFPFFKQKSKINIISIDAFEYLKNYTKHYDYIFADLWHLPEDGLPMYSKILKLEREESTYNYWIEKEMIIMARRAMMILIDEYINDPDHQEFDEQSFSDRLINALDKQTKNHEIDSYEKLLELLKDDALKQIIKNINL